MTRFTGFLLSVFLLMGASVGFGMDTPTASLGVLDLAHTQSHLEISHNSPEFTSIAIHNPSVVTEEKTIDYQTYQSFAIAGEPMLADEGSPSVPMVTRFYRIPNTGGVDLNVTGLDYEVIDHVNPLPITNQDPGFNALARNADVYDKDEWYPKQVAVMSAPMVMRDFRLVTVTLYPVQVNPVTHQARIYRNLSASITANGQPGENEIRVSRRPSGAWAPIYRSMISNLDDSALDDMTTTPGSILILTSTDGAMRPWADSLAQWKTRKGYRVSIDARSSWTYDDARNAILTAYNSWNPSLEYVIIIGEPNVGIPVQGGYGDAYDHNYASLTAGDELEDIGIGRLSGSTAATMYTINNKIMRYERTPHMETSSGVADTTWFHKAFLLAGVARNCASNYLIMRWGQDQFVNNTAVDSVTVTTHASDNLSAADQNNVIDQINAGVGYFLWRGTWIGGMSQTLPESTHPGNRFPITMTVTCNSGDYISSGINSPTEDFLCAGTPNEPQGGVTAIGLSTSYTQNGANGILAAGLIYAIADLNIEHIGDAVASAKAQLLYSYGPTWPDPERTSMPIYLNFTHYFNLLGDPSLSMWTDVPREMIVNHPASLSIGARTVNVTVHDRSTGAALQDALVCLWKHSPDSTWVVGNTDASGRISLPVAVNAGGDMLLTVTKRNHKPYLFTIPCSASGIMPMVSTYTLDDDNSGGTSGNGNHLVNPGETIDLAVYIRNFGTSGSATGVTAAMTSDNSNVTVSAANATYGTIAVGDSALGTPPFRVQVNSGMQNGETVHLTITISSSAGTTAGDIPLVCHAPEMIYTRQTLNATLNPGVTANLRVVLRNSGDLPFTGITGVLTSFSPYVTVNNPSVPFIDAAAGALDSNSTVFSLTASSDAIRGHQASMRLILTNAAGLTDTVQFIVPVGTASSTDPTGPDVYGYYAYDNTDVSYPLHPTFDYIDISGLSGANLNLNDTGEKTTPAPIWSTVKMLPFVFRFYGRWYNQITICSNGWCAFGDQSYLDMFRNYQIPAMGTPDAMIAPYFDDLATSGPGLGVFAYSDATNHRYIIQWKAMGWTGPCAGGGGYNTPLDFEVILYDPTRSPIPEGNGLVLMQYNTVSMNLDNEFCDEAPGCTIGIQAPGNQVGLQYAYQSSYTSGSSVIQNGTAILLETDSTNFVQVPLALLSPNSGGLWAVDSAATITWQGGDLSSTLRLELSRNGVNGPWEVLAAAAPNIGAYSLVVTGPVSDSCRVRITSNNDPNENDMSDQSFTIGAYQVVFSDNFETGAPGWTHASTGGTWVDNWHISTEKAHTGTHSFKCGDTGTGNYSNLCDAVLVTPVISNLPHSTILQFDQEIASEVSGSYADSAYDGGILEISANGGPFTEISPIENYPKTFRWMAGPSRAASGPMRGDPCWAGIDSTVWTQIQVDLSAFHGQSIQLRWRFGSDSTSNNEGWYIDDVRLVGQAPINPPLMVPTNVTLSWDGSDLILRWADDGNLNYRIYSSTNASGPFDTLEGTTASNQFTVSNGPDSAKKFFLVVGWDGN